MRVATLFDIHGNVTAVEAVLEVVKLARVDLIVVGGDVLPGPFAAESLDLLQTSGISTRFIKGNGEVDALNALRAPDADSRVPKRYRPVVNWCANSLSADHLQLIDAWPLTFQIDLSSQCQALFCHATPRDENEIFTCRTAERRLSQIFNGVDATMVVCGHTHMQFQRSVDGLLVVNAGSVGMPFGHTGADWVLVDGGHVEFMHTEYDLSVAAQKIRATAYPDIDGFVEGFLLNPPSESAMLDYYSSAEPSSN